MSDQTPALKAELVESFQAQAALFNDPAKIKAMSQDEFDAAVDGLLAVTLGPLEHVRVTFGFICWASRIRLGDRDYGEWLERFGTKHKLSNRTLYDWRKQAEERLSLAVPASRRPGRPSRVTAGSRSELRRPAIPDTDRAAGEAIRSSEPPASPAAEHSDEGEPARPSSATGAEVSADLGTGSSPESAGAPRPTGSGSSPQQPQPTPPTGQGESASPPAGAGRGPTTLTAGGAVAESSAGGVSATREGAEASGTSGASCDRPPTFANHSTGGSSVAKRPEGAINRADLTAVPSYVLPDYATKDAGLAIFRWCRIHAREVAGLLDDMTSVVAAERDLRSVCDELRKRIAANDDLAHERHNPPRREFAGAFPKAGKK